MYVLAACTPHKLFDIQQIHLSSLTLVLSGPDFPSAVDSLSNLATRGRVMPTAVVGSGRGGDCVPSNSNHELYYEAVAAPAWEVVIRDAGERKGERGGRRARLWGGCVGG